MYLYLIIKNVAFLTMQLSYWTLFFFNISSFEVKQVIQVSSDMRISKWWQNCNFRMNYPFNNTNYYHYRDPGVDAKY